MKRPETEKPERKKIALNPMLSDEEARAVAKETLKDLVLEYQPGQFVSSQGIFLGQWRPKDRAGNSLSKTFNVFAAPEDLPETMKYVDAVEHIAKLKKWHGFDGTNYPTDKEIYAALKDGSYNGGWIIPPRDILSGKDVDGKKAMSDNLFAHQNKGAFKGTFKTAASRDGHDNPDWYWSSTEHRDDLSRVWNVQFSGGHETWDHNHIYRLGCRSVRLAEASV